MLDETAKRIATGERRLGWKVGLNSQAIQERLSLSGPVLGTLTSGTFCADGRLPTTRDGVLLIEAELAIRLDLFASASSTGPSPTLAIAAIAPALELLCIYGALDDPAEVIARNSYHAGFAVGPWTPVNAVTDMDIAELALEVDDGRAFELDRELIVGTPIEIVRFAESFLSSRGERLAAGDIILCGALNPPAIVEPGRRVKARLVPAGLITCEIG